MSTLDFPPLSQPLLGRRSTTYTVLPHSPPAGDGKAGRHPLKKGAILAAVVLTVLGLCYTYYALTRNGGSQTLRLDSAAEFLLNNDFSSVEFEHREFPLTGGRTS
ncbi:hypothetical protein FOZ63_017873, partial [Perkinsus olseni]